MSQLRSGPAWQQLTGGGFRTGRTVGSLSDESSRQCLADDGEKHLGKAGLSILFVWSRRIGLVMPHSPCFLDPAWGKDIGVTARELQVPRRAPKVTPKVCKPPAEWEGNDSCVVKTPVSALGARG